MKKELLAVFSGFPEHHFSEEKAMMLKRHGFRWFRLMKAPINFMTDLALRRCIPIDI